MITGCTQRKKPAPVFVTHAPQKTIRPVYFPSTLRVRKNDTVFKVARRYHISIRGIIEKNNLKAPYTLIPGEIIHLPPPQSHIVDKKDTIATLARLYETDPQSIIRDNNLKAPYTLKKGQVLKIADAFAKTKIHRGSPPPAPSKRLVLRSPAPKKRKAVIRTSYSPPPLTGLKSFILPVKGVLLSKYGAQPNGKRNDGINIKAPLGTPIRAVENGIVVYTGNELKGFGNLILIKHQNGWTSAYAHTQKMYVKRGDRVKKGKVIALLGKTGHITIPQLHFELRKHTKPVNPGLYLPSLS